jgi:hypothetical protein
MDCLFAFIGEVPTTTSASEVDVGSREEGAAARKPADGRHLTHLCRSRDLTADEKSGPRICVADSLEQLGGLMKALRLYDWIQIGVTDMPRAPERP